MKKLSIWCLALVLSLCFVGCVWEEIPETTLQTPTNQENPTLSVHFLDVGQADATLLIQGDSTMLIDGGNVSDSDLIVAYLREKGVETLDYVVLTHGHEDHVGGLAAALANFPVGQVFSPITQYDSNAFENFVKYVQSQNLELTIPNPQDSLYLGQAKVTMLAPLQEYDNPNNMSIALRVEFGETSFLFTGDMEREAEEDLVNSGAFLESTVLQVGHHGSNTSSIYPFLYAVNPTYGVISCELDGQYGHPHEEVLSRFRDADTTLFRTDMQGHITAVSDGKTVQFSAEKNNTVLTNPTEATLTTGEYIGNINSKVFHLETCSGLPSEQNRVFLANRAQATEEGFTPCGRCNP